MRPSSPSARVYASIDEILLFPRSGGLGRPTLAFVDEKNPATLVMETQTIATSPEGNAGHESAHRLHGVPAKLRCDRLTVGQSEEGLETYAHAQRRARASAADHHLAPGHVCGAGAPLRA